MLIKVHNKGHASEKHPDKAFTKAELKGMAQNVLFY